MTRVFKYVDPQFTDAVQSGQLRVGTLMGYAQIEGARRDACENRLTYAFEQSGAINAEGRARLAQHGLQLGSAAGGQMIIQGSNAFCLCFALSDDDTPDERGQSLFEVRDAEALASAISRAEPSLGHPKCGRVHYAPRSIGINSRQNTPSGPFVKDHSFAHEREYRILWTNLGPARTTAIINEPYGAPPVIIFGTAALQARWQPIVLPPDENIARYLILRRDGRRA